MRPLSYNTPLTHTDFMGRRVGGYVIDSIIGVGGMGAVYGAHNALLGKRAAVKVLLGEYTEDRSNTERFFEKRASSRASAIRTSLTSTTPTRLPTTGDSTS